jgi:lipid A 3-O-deacylase
MPLRHDHTNGTSFWDLEETVSKQLALAGSMIFWSVLPLAPAYAGFLDEAKIGVLDHDIGILGHHVESGVDINGELDFKPPGFLEFLGSPHQHIGIAINTAGDTSYLYVAIQPTRWRGLLRSRDSLWVGAQLGGAIHNGNLNHEDDDKKALGTRALYHLGAEVGYQINSVRSVSIYFVHLSNANASSHNPGINDLGLRVGFKF